MSDYKHEQNFSWDEGRDENRKEDYKKFDELSAKEKAVEEFLDLLGKGYRKARANLNERVIEVANRQRMSVYNGCFEALKQLTEDSPDIEVEQFFDDSSASLGTITVNGDTVVFENTRLLALIISAAYSFEVFPARDGRVKLFFGFDNLATEVYREITKKQGGSEK